MRADSQSLKEEYQAIIAALNEDRLSLQETIRVSSILHWGIRIFAIDSLQRQVRHDPTIAADVIKCLVAMGRDEKNQTVRLSGAVTITHVVFEALLLMQTPEATRAADEIASELSDDLRDNIVFYLEKIRQIDPLTYAKWKPEPNR